MFAGIRIAHPFRLLTKIFVIASVPVFVSVLIPPREFYLAGFLNLAFPIVIFINLGVLVYHMFIRSWWSIISLAVLVWPMMIVSNSFSFRNTESDIPGSLHVASNNVNKLYGLDDTVSAVNRKTFLDWIETNQFDVVCTQEMVELADDPLVIADYEKVFSGKTMDDGNYLGPFIFSKNPIVRSGNIHFGMNSFNRLIWADIVVKEDTIRIINVHLKSYDLHRDSLWTNLVHIRDGLVGRSQHTRETHKFIQSSPFPVILCGDFNAPAYSHNYRKISSLLIDTFSASGKGYEYTYRLIGIPYRIDYIFMSPAFKSNAFSVNHEASWSDHQPVSVHIALPGQGE